MGIKWDINWGEITHPRESDPPLIDPSTFRPKDPRLNFSRVSKVEG